MKIRTQTYLKLYLLALITLLLNSINGICQAPLINTEIKKFINKSDLLVHFMLIDKSSTKESMLQTFGMRENGKSIKKDLITTGTYTTYTLDIIEVLIGSLDQDTLEVKMSGGCYEGICKTVSIGYDYSINQEGVIFLKYDETSGNYFSYAASYSAFKVGSGEFLFRGEKEPIREEKFITSFNIKENDQLTLEMLKEQVLIQKSLNRDEQ